MVYFDIEFIFPPGVRPTYEMSANPTEVPSGEMPSVLNSLRTHLVFNQFVSSGRDDCASLLVASLDGLSCRGRTRQATEPELRQGAESSNLATPIRADPRVDRFC